MEKKEKEIKSKMEA